jgi:hypothetical protein
MDGADAEAALEGFTRRMSTLPTCVRKTLTCDQGREIARYPCLYRHVSGVFLDATGIGPEPRQASELPTATAAKTGEANAQERQGGRLRDRGILQLTGPCRRAAERARRRQTVRI